MRKLVSSSIFILTLAAGAPLFAQASSPNQVPDQTQNQPATQGQGQWGHGPRGQFRHHGPNAEFEAKMLSKRLSLTPEQTAQITPILAERQERMKALMPAHTPGATPDSTGARHDFKALHEQMKSIQTETNTRLESVLTPEQKTQFEAMHQHGEHQRGPRGNWTPKSGTTPTA